MGTSCLEIRDASLNFSQTLPDQPSHMLARTLAAVTDTKDPSDLVKGEARRLPVANERQPLEGGRLVIAIARRCSRRHRTDAHLLPEANRLGGDAGRCRKLTDLHSISLLTFQFTGTFSLPEWKSKCCISTVARTGGQRRIALRPCRPNWASSSRVREWRRPRKPSWLGSAGRRPSRWTGSIRSLPRMPRSVSPAGCTQRPRVGQAPPPLSS